MCRDIWKNKRIIGEDKVKQEQEQGQKKKQEVTKTNVHAKEEHRN